MLPNIGGAMMRCWMRSRLRRIQPSLSRKGWDLRMGCTETLQTTLIAPTTDRGELAGLPKSRRAIPQGWAADGSADYPR